MFSFPHTWSCYGGAFTLVSPVLRTLMQMSCASFRWNFTNLSCSARLFLEKQDFLLQPFQKSYNCSAVTLWVGTFSVHRTHISLYIPALLKIKSISGACAVKTPSVRTVCLPPLYTQLPPGIICSIAGFGKQKSGKKDNTFRLMSDSSITAILTWHCAVCRLINILPALETGWCESALQYWVQTGTYL